MSRAPYSTPALPGAQPPDTQPPNLSAENQRYLAHLIYTVCFSTTRGSWDSYDLLAPTTRSRHIKTQTQYAALAVWAESQISHNEYIAYAKALKK